MKRTRDGAMILAVVTIGLALQGGVAGSSTSAPADARGKVHFEAIRPTVFFVRDDNGGLLQQADATIVNPGQPVSVEVQVRTPSGAKSTRLERVTSGSATYRVNVPEVGQTTSVEFTLATAAGVQDRRPTEWRPERHWQIHWVPIAHHDWGYTSPVEDVLSRYDDIYDSVLQFCDETRDWPEDSRYRYTAEGSWSLQHYVAHRPKEVTDKLARYVQEGRIEISAFYGNETTCMCGHEEMVRLIYPSFRLQRQLGGEIATASITDIPGMSWSVPTVLAGAGVKYLFAGLPNYFQWDSLPVPDFWDASRVLRPHGMPDAFWWEGPDGGRVLVYYCGGYGCNRGDDFDETVTMLVRGLEDMDARGAPLRTVRWAAHGCGDNLASRIDDSRIARRWNETWAYPRLIVSTNAMFFRALEEEVKTQGDSIRTFRGELPDTDYVVGAASTARETGINRLTRDRLVSAEKFATAAAMLDGKPVPPDRISEAYDELLTFDEHTWGMDRPAGPLQDWDFSDKMHRAYKAAGLTDSILRRSIESLVDRIRRDVDGQHIVVFNPLSYDRTDVVRATLVNWNPIPDYILEGKFALLDVESNGTVPFQMVRLDSPQAPVPFAAQRYGLGLNTNHHPPSTWRFRHELYDIVFVAGKVPSMGYRTYRIEPRPQAPDSGSGLSLTDTSIENRYYRLTLDPATGAVASLYDKQLGRELVDAAAPDKLNQLVVRWTKDYRRESATNVSIRRGCSGPVYASLVVTAAGAGCPQITQEIVLYDELKRIDFNNRVLKDSTPHMEIYFAFPFDLASPRFLFEGTNSVIRPFVDQFPGSNTNYYAVQHWAMSSDSQAAVVLSPIESHLMEFGGMWPCRTSQAHHGITNPHFAEPFINPEQISKGHMYSLAIDSNFRTNFQPTQQGDMLQRYCLTSLGSDPASLPVGAARDFGWAAGQPLIALGAQGRRAGKLPPAGSFCRIDAPNVLLTAMKRAEDGDGYILRLTETEGRSAEVGIDLPMLKIARACRTNLAEENGERLPPGPNGLKLSVTAHSITTIRVCP